jgi:hypothetical protein
MGKSTKFEFSLPAGCEPYTICLINWCLEGARPWAARQGCQARLPGKAARQGCQARLPGKAARQGCQARLPGKADRKGSRARLHAMLQFAESVPAALTAQWESQQNLNFSYPRAIYYLFDKLVSRRG